MAHQLEGRYTYCAGLYSFQVRESADPERLRWSFPQQLSQRRSSASQALLASNTDIFGTGKQIFAWRNGLQPLQFIDAAAKLQPLHPDLYCPVPEVSATDWF